jgi:hypothetical protein
MATLSIVQSPNNGLLLTMAPASGRVPLRDAPSAVLNSPMGRNASTTLAAAAQQRLLEHSQAVKLVRSNADSRLGIGQQREMHASRVAGAGNNRVMVNVQVDERERSLSGLQKPAKEAGSGQGERCTTSPESSSTACCTGHQHKNAVTTAAATSHPCSARAKPRKRTDLAETLSKSLSADGVLL